MMKPSWWNPIMLIGRHEEIKRYPLQVKRDRTARVRLLVSFLRNSIVYIHVINKWELMTRSIQEQSHNLDMQCSLAGPCICMCMSMSMSILNCHYMCKLVIFTASRELVHSTILVASQFAHKRENLWMVSKVGSEICKSLKRGLPFPLFYTIYTESPTQDHLKKKKKL